MSKKIRIAILASGSGTTAEALLQKIDEDLLDVEPVLIIHNNPDAGIVDQPAVNKLGLKKVCINTRMYPRNGDGTKKGELSDAESEAIVAALKENEIDLVLLLGYMKRVRGALMTEYGFNPDAHKKATDCRMLNIHPGPLPETTGLYGSYVHQRVYELYKEGKLTKTGPTLHAVSEGYDEGPVVKFFDEITLRDQDTAESIESRVRSVERERLYEGISDFVGLAGV